MKRILLFACLAFCVVALQAAPNGGFGMDAFNRAVSAATRGNAVFSPFSFEIDCVVFSEAVDALTRAKLAETMGVLNGLEAVYHPMYEALAKESDGQFLFDDARGFCFLNERKVNPTFRIWLQRTFSAEAFAVSCRQGAENWFRSRMNGAMEDFALQSDAASEECYSYYNLLSVRFPWKHPFPTNQASSVTFAVDADNAVSLPALADVRAGDIMKRRRYSALRLRLSEDTLFFAVLPNKNLRVRDIRGDLRSDTLNDFVAGFKSVTELDIFHGPVAVVIPKMDITTESDLKLPFEYFRFPTQGLERMKKDVRARYLRQRVRFRLDGSAAVSRPAAEKPEDDAVMSSAHAKPFALDRPFLFFVYHEPTASVPIVGQFMGR